MAPGRDIKAERREPSGVGLRLIGRTGGLAPNAASIVVVRNQVHGTGETLEGDSGDTPRHAFRRFDSDRYGTFSDLAVFVGMMLSCSRRCGFSTAVAPAAPPGLGTVAIPEALPSRTTCGNAEHKVHASCHLRLKVDGTGFSPHGTGFSPGANFSLPALQAEAPERPPKTNGRLPFPRRFPHELCQVGILPRCGL